MTYNVDLMLEVRNAIKADPEKHNQAYYECGTTRCIAGWTITLATGQSVAKACIDDGNSAFDLGADLLGLHWSEACNLFYDMDGDRALAKLDELIEKGKNQ